jgi:creatinine amidohydrolase
MRNNNSSSRRGFMQAGVSGASLALAPTSSAAEEPQKVRYAELLPHEFRKRLAERPIAYLPIGTLEWHGEHLALGSDALQAEGLMVECARRFGGIVMPAIHLGPDHARPAGDGRMLYGMDLSRHTKPPRRLDGSCYWVPLGLHMMLVDAILEQLKRAGFQAVFADGHGPSRGSWVQNIPARESRFGLKLFGVTQDIAKQWKSQIDHAGRNETSLMMHVHPRLVDLSQLPADPATEFVGVSQFDPRDASAAFGKECFETSIELVRQMFVKAGVLA